MKMTHWTVEGSTAPINPDSKLLSDKVRQNFVYQVFCDTAEQAMARVRAEHPGITFHNVKHCGKSFLLLPAQDTPGEGHE